MLATLQNNYSSRSQFASTSAPSRRPPSSTLERPRPPASLIRCHPRPEEARSSPPTHPAQTTNTRHIPAWNPCLARFVSCHHVEPFQNTQLPANSHPACMIQLKPASSAAPPISYPQELPTSLYLWYRPQRNVSNAKDHTARCQRLAVRHLHSLLGLLPTRASMTML